MPGNIETLYGTNGQTITVTLASLATSSVFAGQASTVIDNTTNVFQDALLLMKIKTGTPLVAPSYVTIYAYGTVDNGTTYTEAATGSNAALTLTSPPNARVIGVLSCPTATTTYIAGPWSVAAAFGGILPQKWGIIVVNTTGAALDATEGNHAKLYQGVLTQYT